LGSSDSGLIDRPAAEIGFISPDNWATKLLGRDSSMRSITRLTLLDQHADQSSGQAVPLHRRRDINAWIEDSTEQSLTLHGVDWAIRSA
jgi:hypothetical protein